MAPARAYAYSSFTTFRDDYESLGVAKERFRARIKAAALDGHGGVGYTCADMFKICNTWCARSISLHRAAPRVYSESATPPVPSGLARRRIALSTSLPIFTGIYLVDTLSLIF